MTTGRRSIQAYRRTLGAAQAFTFLALPFVRVGGESALRFDVPSLTLHVFGASLAMNEFIVVLPATLFLAFAFLFVTMAFGRVWCGWSCPQTVLSDLTRLAGPWGAKRRPPRWRRPAGLALVALVSALFSAATLWYFVAPADFLDALLAGRLGPVLAWCWAVLGLTLFLDLAFLRARFCATACPYAKVQGVLFDRNTLVVAYDGGRDADCVDCGACVRCCPTGIDIRDGLQMECIACAECIDACRPIMLKLKRKPDLVGYFFGEPGRARHLLRPGVVAMGLATVLALGATVSAGASAAAATLDLTAVPASDFPPRLAGDGRALNAYQVSLENRAHGPVTVRLGATAPGLALAPRPALVTLASGEHKRLRVVVEARGPAGRVMGELRVEAAGEGVRTVTRTSTIPVVVPEAR